MEERLAILESDVRHIRSDVADVKVDLRRLNDKVDGLGQQLGGKIDTVDHRLNDKIGGVEQKLGDKIDEVDRRLGSKIDDLNDKIDEVDQRLNGKIDGVEQRLSGKIDAINDKIDGVDLRQSEKTESVKDSLAKLALSMEKSFAELRIGRAMDRVWWLLMLAAMLGIMARGFKWI